MQITMYDRVILPSILPIAPNFHDAILKKAIMKKLVFEEEDIAKYGIKSDGINTYWDVDEKFEIEFTELQLSLITRSMEKLKEIPDFVFPDATIALIEKFIPDYFS